MPLWTSPPSMGASPALDWALWYAANGWQVFPCHTPTGPMACSCRKTTCDRIGKHPRIQHGLNAASQDPAIVAQWWRQWPDANIALRTGAVSGLAVLDEDTYKGGDYSRIALETSYAPLPDTVQQCTGGGGMQYLFLHPGSQVKNGVQTLGVGLDIRGDGGYVIAPPSLHVSGKRYIWEITHGPDDVLLAPFPPWLLALINAQHSAKQTLTNAGAIIPNGERNDTLFRLGCSMRARGFTEAAILGALSAINATQCETPLDDDEVRTLAHSCGSYLPPGQLHARSHAIPNMTPPTASTLPQASTGAPTPAVVLPPFPPPIPHGPLLITDLADMFERTYPKQQWLIQDLIPEGLTFFVGSPKSSKTYLAYSLALSLAYDALQGGSWLNTYDVLLPGPVVYITLEDDEADSRNRIAELMPNLMTIERDRFLFIHGFDLPQFHEGLVDKLHEEVMERYRPALLVLDPISYLYAPTKKGGDQFAEVKDMLLPLRGLGKVYHCAVLGVDHRRKKSVDDVDIFETTYGSNAKIAVADSLLMIVRDQGEITIHARVRKASDQTLTLSLTFDNAGCAHWEFKGAVDGLLGGENYGEVRTKVCAMLAGRAGQSFSLEEIILELNWVDSKQTRSQLKQALYRAKKAHEVTTTGQNKYVWSGVGLIH